MITLSIKQPRLSATLVIALLLVLGNGFPYFQSSSTAVAQQPNTLARPLDSAAMQAELERLAEVCDRLGLADEANTCRQWLPDLSRTDRRCLFLPTPFPQEQNATGGETSSARAKWRQHFIAARRAHAQWWFSEVQRLAGNGEAAQAYRLLWRVVREDPEHEQAKRILGTLLNAVQVRPKLRPSSRPHEQFGWAGNSYNTIQSPHFLLTTRADTGASISLAQQLEETYALWTQTFFEQWCTPEIFLRRMKTIGTWPETRKMEVVLLEDRNDYVQTLGVSEQNIGVSVGYYSPRGKMSFFYPGEDLTDTFRHELTHQLFSEGSRLNVLLDAGELGGVWQLEGIAIYMESLADRGHGWWTVGGIESPRLQTARYRAIRDGYWPDWKSFAAGTVDEWKSDPNVALLYAHAAGLTHALLDLGDAASRHAYLNSLEAIYTGRPATSLELLAQLGEDEEKAKLAYQKRLTISDSQFRQLLKDSPAMNQLVLAASELQPETWALLSELQQLTWLDASFANCTSQDLLGIEQLVQLQRLSVEGTAADGRLLPIVAKLTQLNELDLSGCNINDNDLAALSGSQLDILWLTKTAVTDACLNILASLPNLKTCDVAGTKISSERWQEFCKEHGINEP